MIAVRLGFFLACCIGSCQANLPDGATCAEKAFVGHCSNDAEKMAMETNCANECMNPYLPLSELSPLRRRYYINLNSCDQSVDPNKDICSDMGLVPINMDIEDAATLTAEQAFLQQYMNELKTRQAEMQALGSFACSSGTEQSYNLRVANTEEAADENSTVADLCYGMVESQSYNVSVVPCEIFGVPLQARYPIACMSQGVPDDCNAPTENQCKDSGYRASNAIQCAETTIDCESKHQGGQCYLHSVRDKCQVQCLLPTTSEQCEKWVSDEMCSEAYVHLNCPACNDLNRREDGACETYSRLGYCLFYNTDIDDLGATDRGSTIPQQLDRIVFESANLNCKETCKDASASVINNDCVSHSHNYVSCWTGDLSAQYRARCECPRECFDELCVNAVGELGNWCTTVWEAT